jgi:hypothetical protein
MTMNGFNSVEAVHLKLSSAGETRALPKDI